MLNKKKSSFLSCETWIFVMCFVLLTPWIEMGSHLKSPNKMLSFSFEVESQTFISVYNGAQCENLFSPVCTSNNIGVGDRIGTEQKCFESNMELNWMAALLWHCGTTDFRLNWRSRNRNRNRGRKWAVLLHIIDV